MSRSNTLSGIDYFANVVSVFDLDAGTSFRLATEIFSRNANVHRSMIARLDPELQSLGPASHSW